MITDGYRAGVSASPPTVEELTALRVDIERLSAEREHYRELYLQMLEQCRKLELGLLGQKSERLGDNDAQLTMSVLATLLGERPAVDEVRRRSRFASTSGRSRPAANRCPSSCRVSRSRFCRTTCSAKGSTRSSASVRTSARPSSDVPRRWSSCA